MSLGWWLTLYTLNVAFVVWIFRFDGARRLAHSRFAWLMEGRGVWKIEIFQILVALEFVCATVTFVVGLVRPDLRGCVAWFC